MERSEHIRVYSISFRIVQPANLRWIIVVYGFLIPAIGWNLAVIVWVYEEIVFLIVDQFKVRYYNFFDEGLQFMEKRLKAD